MFNIRPVAPLVDADRLAVVRVRAEFAKRCRSAAFLRRFFVDQRHGAVEADGEHVLVRSQGDIPAVIAEIGAEPANSGGDCLAGFRMVADRSGEGEQRQGDFERNLARRMRFRQCCALRLDLVFALAFRFAELHIAAERPLAQRDRLAAFLVIAKLYRKDHGGIVVVIAGYNRQRACIAAVRIVAAADKGTAPPEFESQPPRFADRALARVRAVFARREEMRSQVRIERIDNIGNLERAGFLHLLVEGPPEIPEHGLPVGIAGGDAIERIFQVCGEIVLDVAREIALEKCGDDTAAMLRNEALAFQPDVIPVLKDRDDRGIGRRASDPQLLKPLDQACLGEAGRRLGKMLLGAHCRGR